MMSIAIDILVKNKPIDKYLDGFHNVFVEGRKGSEYVIRLMNRSQYNYKCVVSVDGKNILTGDQEWEKGYIVEKFSHLDIPGWRIDKDNIAKFIFCDIKNGYSDISNAGVIGVMCFQEIVNAISSSYRSMPLSASSYNSTSIATGWGDTSKFKTTTYHGKFNESPDSIISIYYDSLKGLESRGIKVNYKSSTPNPFPNYKIDFGCRPPKR